MKTRLLIFAAGTVALAALVWTTMAWVPEDGAVRVWDQDTGLMRVPAKGLVVLPRWSDRRSGAEALITEVPATTSDGAAVTVSVSLEPPVGVWRLQPAGSPREGLLRRVTEPAQKWLAALPLQCVVQGGTVECPADPALDLRRVLAMELAIPEGALAVRLNPEAGAVQASIVGEIASRLEIPQRKVLVLGLDALDWDLVLPWVEVGRLPNLARLMEAGTWGEMETIVPILSPLIWTTMATGFGPDVHGVLDFIETDPVSGETVPVTGRGRKVPAIWNIASALGLEVGVVGWWATWPAERVNGTMVSDRLYYTLQQGIPKETFHTDPPDLVFPAERTAEFTELRDRAVAESDWRAVGHFMRVSEEVFDHAVAANLGMEDPVDGMRRILSATRAYMGAGLALAAEQPDLLMVYLEGTDTVGHLLAPYMPPPTQEVDPDEAAIYAAAVPRYFEVVDRWIGRYLEQCPLEEYAVVLVSDHGFKWGRERPRGLSGTAGPTAPLWHAEDAVFVVAGPGVERRGRVSRKGPSVYDLAPTVAALLGVPADPAWREPLPGCPAPEAEPVEWFPLLPPASYRQGGGVAAPADPEFLARLKAIGYIGEDGVSAGEAARATPTSRSAGAAPVTPTPQPETATRGQINNLAVIKINEKQYEEAERLLHQVIAMSPTYPAPHYNLRRLYMETRQWEKADEHLWIAIDKGFRDPERTLDRAAADYENFDLPDRAEAILVRAISRFPEHEPFYVHLMVVRVRDDRCAEALPVGAVAAEKFPESGPVHAFYGLAAACVGQAEVARRELELSLEINPDQPMLRQALEQVPE